MKIELTRFRVKPGKAQRVDDWMATLHQRKSEVLATLEREHMLVEVIFRETIGAHDYLSWFSMQGEHGEAVETSPYDVDRVHLEFWQECIDPDFHPQDATSQVVMIPEAIATKLTHYLTPLPQPRLIHQSAEKES